MVRIISFSRVLCLVILFNSCRNEVNKTNPKDKFPIDTAVLKKTTSPKVVKTKTVHTDSLLEKQQKTLSVISEKQKKYEVMSFYNEHLKIKLPVSFNLMNEDFVKAKYPTLNANLAKVYSNSDGKISILLELSNSPLKSNELPNIKNQIAQSFGSIPEIDLQNIIVKKLNNKDFVVVEFTSEAIDTRLYNLMFITDINGKTFTGTFNCTIDYLKEWKPIAQEILKSITIKK
ncbi:MAG: hypothetical protein ACOVLC_13645 [Flavobacterium sp.]